VLLRLRLAAPTMSYQLQVMGTSTIVEMSTDAVCADLLSFPITPGEYSLYAEGTDAMGRTVWMGICDMLVADGGIDRYNCFFDRFPP
jgi:hypothetical protein